MATVGTGTDRSRRPWRWIVVAALVVAVTVPIVMLVNRPWRPSAEYRPGAVDVVTSITQVGAAWDLGLESGAHVLFTASIRDLLRPGGNLSPSAALDRGTVAVSERCTITYRPVSR
jgi:hypothetical protein